MEIRLMEYVLAVSEEKSFTKAAERLCIAQPSLSQQIAKLEADLGMRLFHRGPKGVTLTADGRQFINRAQQILLLHHDFLQEMRERTQGMGDRLSIGTTAITGGHLLPRMLSLFHCAYPSVQPRLVEESTEVLTDLLLAGEIELAILPLPVDHPSLETTHILTEPLFLAFPPTEQPWMTQAIRRVIRDGEGTQAITMAAVSAAPFVVLKRGFGFRRTLFALCANDGFQPQVSHETSSIDTAQAMVTYGLGVTVVPEMVVLRHQHPRPIYVAMESQPTRSLVFAYPRDRYVSLAARAFIEIAGQYRPSSATPPAHQ